MPKIYDNIENQLIQGLNETLELSNRTDFCVGYFNLRGWKEVADKIDSLTGAPVVEENLEINRICRLLVGMQKMPIEILREHFSQHGENQMDLSEAVKIKKRLAQEFKDQLTIGIPSEADEIALRKLSQQMKDGKVIVKLHLRYTLHAKLYLAFSRDKRVPIIGFLGSSNLTLAGLSKQGELNIDVMDQDSALKLSKWFNDRWKDRWCLDITNELIEIIDESWAGDRLVSPYHIYIKMAYHLSREARAGLSEFKLPRNFQKDLLDFQQKAVLIAAHHLHKRGGVIVGDVVGLGKTIIATGIAKLFEEDFFLETLIICPKNLVEMWEDYAHQYQLRAKVISQSKVQSILPNLRRYRLVIIDESHNLRNDQGSRYRAIKEYLEENESKVILLSATPYNKSYHDLSNQLRLFIPDDKDLGISPERYIERIGGATQFGIDHADTFIRSIKAFEKSDIPDDWRELMRLYLVRRTRSFIKDNYAKLDESNGRKYLLFPDGTRSYFPDRIPRVVEYPFNPNDSNDLYARLYSKEVVDIINGLNLPRYGLQNYRTDQPIVTPTREENLMLENLSRAGKRLMGFCRTNLFKRLESSGYSFLLSLGRHIMRNYVFIYALQNRLKLPIGKNISQNLDGFLFDIDLEESTDSDNQMKLFLNQESYYSKAAELYEIYASEKHRKQFDWISGEFFADHFRIIEQNGKKKSIEISLIKELLSDSNKILKILNIGKSWSASDDKQLNALFNLITHRHKDDKVLVFTQFADTANYIVKEFIKRGVTQLEVVSGESDSPTHLAHRFSPISNKKPEIKNSNKELRVLVATDVLSEGQNLQDSHIILNYDLPWAIIRLIQRAGRVDRIGQKAEKIFCYSFLPEDGIEDIINLRGRLRRRIVENAEVVGSDETFFDGDPINLHDLYNERSGILDSDEGDTEVDLASFAYQIWKNAIDENPELKKLIPDLPNVIYGTKKNNTEPFNEGVIIYTRTSEENDVLAWVNQNSEILTQSQYTILKAAQCHQNENPEYRLVNHHELVNKGIEFIREDEKITGGSLGRKTGIKYRAFMRLERYINEFEGSLFVTEQLKRAINDIYKYPLREFAKETISRQLKAGIDDEQLANLVVSLREEDKLSIISEEENVYKEPQIVCSLGLINK